MNKLILKLIKVNEIKVNEIKDNEIKDIVSLSLQYL